MVPVEHPVFFLRPSPASCRHSRTSAPGSPTALPTRSRSGSAGTPRARAHGPSAGRAGTPQSPPDRRRGADAHLLQVLSRGAQQPSLVRIEGAAPTCARGGGAVFPGGGYSKGRKNAWAGLLSSRYLGAQAETFHTPINLNFTG
jgi:hypothetical protein